MIERGGGLRAKAKLRDGEEEEAEADELEQKGERLLNAFAPGDGSGLLRGHPEAQSGDRLLAAGAVEQVERNRTTAEDRGQPGRRIGANAPD